MVLKPCFIKFLILSDSFGNRKYNKLENDDNGDDVQMHFYDLRKYKTEVELFY